MGSNPTGDNGGKRMNDRIEQNLALLKKACLKFGSEDDYDDFLDRVKQKFPHKNVSFEIYKTYIVARKVYEGF